MDDDVALYDDLIEEELISTKLLLLTLAHANVVNYVKNNFPSSPM
jgi:hypothetical protein